MPLADRRAKGKGSERSFRAGCLQLPAAGSTAPAHGWITQQLGICAQVKIAFVLAFTEKFAQFLESRIECGRGMTEQREGAPPRREPGGCTGDPGTSSPTPVHWPKTEKGEGSPPSLATYLPFSSYTAVAHKSTQMPAPALNKK